MSSDRLIWRVFLPLSGITLVAVASILTYSITNLYRFYQEQTTIHLLDLAKTIALQLGQDEAQGELDETCKRLGKELNVRVTIISDLGRVLGDSHDDPNKMEDHSTRPEVRQAIARGRGWSSRLSPTLGTRMIYAAVRTTAGGQALIIRTSVAATAPGQAMAGLLRKTAAATAVIMILAVAVSWLVARHISRPIIQMKKAVSALAAGNLDERAPQTGPAEIRTLATAFNQMAEQLQARIATITQQRSELEAMLAAMVEAVIVVDSQARITWANQAAGRFLVVEPKAALGLHITQAIANPRLVELISQAICLEQQQTLQEQLVTRDGRSYQMRGLRLQIARGPLVGGAVLVLYDMTELRRLEQVRKEFVANVAHELKTPITSIKGFAETLLDELPADMDQARRYSDIIARQADRLNSIIDDLLTLARLEEDRQVQTLALRHVYLRQVIDSAIEQAMPKADAGTITIQVDCDPSLQAKANPTLLERAIYNLLDNAIKYSKPGQSVELTAKKVENKVQIQVTDHGCGIPSEHLPRLFERFYVVDKARARQLGGTGLGLAIVKHIVQLHGGTVAVESQEGKGSTFTISLPTGST